MTLSHMIESFTGVESTAHVSKRKHRRYRLMFGMVTVHGARLGKVKGLPRKDSMMVLIRNTITTMRTSNEFMPGDVFVGYVTVDI